MEVQPYIFELLRNMWNNFKENHSRKDIEVYIGGCMNGTQYKVVLGDRDALCYTLYYKVEGREWDEFLGWNADEDPFAMSLFADAIHDWVCACNLACGKEVVRALESHGTFASGRYRRNKEAL